MTTESEIMERTDRAVATFSPGFHSATGFELLQREARMFTESGMVPDTFRDYVLDKQTGEWTENKQARSNAIIALNMALRMKADPLMVMQNLIIIHGRPSWSAQFLIGLFNTCGKFTAIRYAMNEQKDFCFAYCTEIATGERIEGPSVSIAMAKAEGWYDRKGSKWRTMPELMLRNRSAAFLIRTTAPELSLGLPIADEIPDIVDIEAREVRPASLQAVRDILRDAPMRTSVSEPEPVADEPPPAPVAEGVPQEVSPMMEEPAHLPLKDGDLTERDANRVSKPKAKAKATTESNPDFDAEAYRRRIERIEDVDLLTLIKEEVATLPPLVREDMAALIDARIHSLIPTEGDAS